MIESENSQKQETSPEQQKAPESSSELKEQNDYAGASILENPPEGSFVLGLQTFVAWVQRLVSK